MPAEKTAIGIVGSYRREGVVATAVAEVLSQLEKQGVATATVFLLDEPIGFCTNCRMCMQSPGPGRGQCIQHDGMDELLSRIERADYLVIGAPVNFGNVNALTRRFIERCVPYAYWPWGAPAPKLRNRVRHKKVVLVSSSAAPSWVGRYAYGAARALKKLSRVLGAKVVGVLWIGSVIHEPVELTEKASKTAKRLARKLTAG
ncbi:MAG: flavodoxin family protein [Planctomycetes bacterium]|nr:flavodoxin family protein [Planctomycetota bacterium]